MNRRDFLHLFTVTAAAAVAGLRPRPEPTEVVTRLGRGSRDTLDNFGISASTMNQGLKDFLLKNKAVAEVNGPLGFLVPPEMIEDLKELAAMKIEEPT